MLGVDSHGVTRLDFGEPGELHDRAAGSSEDCRLDVLGLPLDVKTLAALEMYFGRRCHRAGVLRVRAYLTVVARLFAGRATARR